MFYIRPTVLIRLRYLLLLLMLSGTACKKNFLDVSDNSYINRQSYVRDIVTMQQYLNGIYLRLSTNADASVLMVYNDLVADNVMPIASFPELVPHYRWEQEVSDEPKTTDASLNTLYIQLYKLIRDCSFVVSDADKYRESDPVKSDHIKGQALAIRAMLHLKLLDHFAQTYVFSTDGSHPGIAYITTDDPTVPVERNSVKAAYELLLKDLKASLLLMDPSANDVRFMNHAAAEGLLARALLNIGNYNEAVYFSRRVTDKYLLLTAQNGYPDSLFRRATLSDNEVLMQLPPSIDAVNTSFIGRYYAMPRFEATPEVAGLLTANANDLRSKWCLQSGGWKVTKYPKGVAKIHTVPEADYYQPIIRCSELYLIAAESYANLNRTDSAIYFLDAIRKRADPQTASTVASGNALVELIRLERRKELAFEGFRMTDLQRWKLGVHRITVYADAPKELPFGSDHAIAPLPLTEVTISKMPQNKGY